MLYIIILNVIKDNDYIQTIEWKLSYSFIDEFKFTFSVRSSSSWYCGVMYVRCILDYDWFVKNGANSTPRNGESLYGSCNIQLQEYIKLEIYFGYAD